MVSVTVLAEIGTVALRSASVRGIPGYLDEFKVVPDTGSASLRSKVRLTLLQFTTRVHHDWKDIAYGADRTKGLEGDATIGTTAIASGRPLITSDETFAEGMQALGHETRLFTRWSSDAYDQ